MRLKILFLLCLLFSKSLAAQEIDSIVDNRDQHIYKVVKIGQQWWMQENLNTGIRINGNSHQTDNGMIEKYCYNNNEDNCNLYGALYSWDEMMDYSPSDEGNPGTTSGICPAGWSVPTDDEWKELEMYLGMTRAEADMVNTWRGTGVGTKLRSGGSSGYEALYAGRVSSSGFYYLLGLYEYVWTSTEYEDYAWRRCLSISADNVGRWNTFPKNYGFSVRCIKDSVQFNYLALLDKNFKTISKLNFANEKITDTIILFNSSAGKTIHITSVSNTNSAFNVSKSSAVLPPGDTLILNISFDSPEEGIHYSDTLIIESDDPFNSIITIPLEGYLEPVVAKICIVTVDTTSGKNQIIWEKDPDTGIAFYNIYRKSLMKEQYDLIGTKSYDDLSIFTDTTSIPETRAYLYKISAVDTGDHESPMSPYHKPLILQYIVILDGVYLKWDQYEIEGGTISFEAYELYRGFNPDSLTKITDITVELNTYIDTNTTAQQKTCYYRLAGRLTNPCCPAMNKKPDIIYTRSFSNLEDNAYCSGCDVTPPTVPDRMEISAAGNTITLIWSPSVDDCGVVSYNIYNGNHNKIITVYDTNHVFTELEYDSTYSFMITAVDSSGNESEKSNLISATTEEITGLNNYTKDQIIIYPNPFKESATFRWDNPGCNAHTLYVMDLSGKVYRIVENIRTSTYILKKGDLKEGLYIVELRGAKIYRAEIVIE